MTAATVVSEPELQQALKLGYRLVGSGDTGAYALGAVHRRASAEGYDGLAALFMIKLHALFNHIAGGVCPYVVE